MISKNIFLSNSGKLSNAVAYTFYRFLPYVLQDSQCFISGDDIKKGATWFTDIKTALIEAKTGIVFLTNENYQLKPWVFIEFGALLTKANTFIVLCDLELNTIEKQQSIFQHINATILGNKEDLKKLMIDLKSITSPHIEDKYIESAFEKYYAEFKDAINNAMASDDIKISNTMDKFEGDWLLNYNKEDGTRRGWEPVYIDKNGTYFVKTFADRHAKFRLNLLNENEGSYTWQKVDVDEDGNDLSSVYSVENLRLENRDKLVGTDTNDYILVYTRMK